MRKIEYKYSPRLGFLTRCPFGLLASGLGNSFVIWVGSDKCRNCSFNVNTNFEDNSVECACYNNKEK